MIQPFNFRDTNQKPAVTSSNETEETHQAGVGAATSNAGSEENGNNQSCNNCSGKFVDNSAKFCHNCGTHRQ